MSRCKHCSTAAKSASSQSCSGDSSQNLEGHREGPQSPSVQQRPGQADRTRHPDLKHLQVLGSQSAPRSLNFIFSPRWSVVGQGRPQGTYLLPDRPPTHTHTDLLINTNTNTIHKDHCHTYVFIDTHTWTQHVNMYRGTHCRVHTLHYTETH